MSACSILYNVERFLCAKPFWDRDPTHVLEGHGTDDLDSDSEPQRPHTPPWKFWRKLSTRHVDRKPRDRKDIIKVEWSTSANGDGDGFDDCLTPLNSTLPDVVEKTGLCRSNSLKPPPKPPRLFLFRSASINNPRSSLDGGSARNSVVMAQPKSTSSEFDGKNKKNICVKQENGKIKPVIVPADDTENNNIKDDSERKDVLTSLGNHSPTLQNSSHNKMKIVTSDLTPKKPVRSRRKSSEKNQDVSRQKLIMQSILDLLCQKLDPFPLLKQLHESNVLSDSDVLAYKGHPDRRLICESLANAVGEGSYSHFVCFCDVLRKSGNYVDIVQLLDVMKEVDQLVHDIPCLSDDDNPILADEKTICFEIGYYNPETFVLKPVVELERARNDHGLSKRLSRISTTSWDTSSEVSNGITDQCDIMMNVCVTGYSLSGNRAKALARVVEKYNCILELRIGKTQLCGEDITVLSKALSHNTGITSLDVRLNNIDAVGASALADTLKVNTCLRQVNLSSTGIELSGCQVIAGALTNNKTLVEIDMSFLDIGDKSCEYFRDMLKTNSTLQKLRLRSNNISWPGCCTLMDGLSRNRCLTELDLSRNYVGDAGVEILSRYIPESMVTDLSLENCGITSDGCGSLAELLAISKKLRSIDLSVNFISDTGVMKLASCLERSSTLHLVGLNMCGITNDGFSKLLDVLEKNTSISLLKLCYNRLGREHNNPAATSDNLRYRLRIVTSSKPKLRILLWGNSFEDS
ncbi:uncharacterized protein LOC124136477 isoform X4 [Haliotis rufescens]|uniref:uncharacterized protein LOC124136477 isoform X4 n=1 Tax=Haliotis rufescens TaxID=6454 RepID=UPI001EB0496D|nr:uncharacterized protein LOC124136477 isoform X4 [Haliotis rufescens]